MSTITLQDVDPRVLITHFEEQISQRRKTLNLEDAKIQGFLLLEQQDRKTYLCCLAAMKRFESLHGSLGIKTPADMMDHIQLVEHLALQQRELTAADLRKFSLDLLRSMSLGVVKAG